MSIVSRSTQQYSGFDPRSIPGCALWLDAADSNTVIRSGNNVAQWNDKSGNANHTSDISGTIIYTNDTPRRISLTRSYLTGGFKTAFTGSNMECFAVATMSSSADQYGRILSLGRPGVNDYNLSDTTFPFIRNNSGLSLIVGRQSAYKDVSLSAYDTLFLVRSGHLGNGNEFISVNGGTEGTLSTVTGNFNITSYGIGTNTNTGDTQYWVGHICEIVVYLGVTFTTTQRQQVEGYLADKWGMRTNLPTGHPNKSIQPIMRPFQPSDIDGLQIWLDAADASTVSFGSGSNVSQWRDKTWNGYSVNQTDTSLQPIYTNSGVQLDVNKYLFTAGSNVSAFSSGTSMSVFVVARNASGNTGWNIVNTMWFDSTGNGGTYRYHFSFNQGGTTGTTLYANSALVGQETSNAVPINTTAILGFTLSPTSASIHTNGSVNTYNGVSLPSANNSTVFILGDNRNNGSVSSNIVVNEFLGFNTQLTTTQRQQVEGYLAAKWGLSGSLPTTQPYYLLRSLPSTPVFVPSQLSGLQLWLDAADASTVTGTNPVTAWADKSGNGRNLGVGSGTTTYESRSIKLNTSYMFVSSAVDLTNVSLFIVCLSSQNINNQTVFSGRPNTSTAYNSTDGIGFYVDIGGIRCYGQQPSGQFVQNTGITTTSTFMSSFTANSNGSLSSWQTGTTAGTGTMASRTNSAQGFAIGGEWGGSSYGNITSTTNIYEVVVYNTLLTTSQRQAVEGYLAWKWGLQQTLPLNYNRSILSPLAIPGCALWLDAADASTVDGTTSVTQWRDKSGIGHDMATPTGTVTYNASTKYITFAASSKLTNSAVNYGSQYRSIFAVVKIGNVLTANTLNYAIINGSTLTKSMQLYTYGTGGALAYARAGNALLTAGSPSGFFNSTSIVSATNSPGNLGIFTNGASQTLTENNTETYTFATGSADQSIGGGSASFDIAELIIYDGQTTTAQRQSVEAYLQNKWNVAVPIAHPYKKFRP